MGIKSAPSAVRGPAIVACCAALVLGACRREEVTHFRVPKAPPQTALASAGAASPGGGAMAGDVGAPPRPASPLAWTLPKGWAQELTGGMRYATLRAPVEGKIDGSVVVLPGPAGGELANVNRWRGQIGLAPVDDAALASARKVVPTKAGDLRVYDFTSDGEKKSRMVVALAEVDGSTWFLKLTGDAGAVGAARADFLRLLESVHRGSPNP